MVYVIAIISIALSAIAQYLLKVGVGRLGWLSADSLGEKIIKLLSDWALIGGIGCYVASMVFWLIF